MDDKLFDSIVTSFYDAATGAGSWDDSMAQLANAFGVHTAALQTTDIRTGHILSMHHGGIKQSDATLNYIREYHKVDPRRAKILSNLPALFGSWWHCHEHFDDSFVQQNSFYRDFLPAYDTRFLSVIAFQTSEHFLSALALEIPATRGVLTREERELASRLSDHLQKAISAFERVRRMAAQALAGHSLLQSFAYPMWLIDQDRFISFGNAAAKREAESESLVAVKDRRLIIRRTSLDQLLTQKLHDLYHGEADPKAMLNLCATCADRPVWLHLSRLEPGTVMGAFGNTPQVLATLFDPGLPLGLDSFALGSMFNLTPTESRVATLLASGLTPEAICEKMGIGIQTVRTHNKNLLSKFGVNRTTDMVRLIIQGEPLWSSKAGVH